MNIIIGMACVYIVLYAVARWVLYVQRSACVHTMIVLGSGALHVACTLLQAPSAR